MLSNLLFLPGASGNTSFWKPVSDSLVYPAKKTHISYPGYGSTPSEPDINSLDDLAAKIVAEIEEPTALIAQSMGGVIAIIAALEKPTLITHLVLCATSGGMDMSSMGAEDWRPSFVEEYPTLPNWFSSFRGDLTERIPTVNSPTLLLWGDADPISPVRVGQRLESLLPHATLHTFVGGDHGFANTFSSSIAPLIDKHLINVN